MLEHPKGGLRITPCERLGREAEQRLGMVRFGREDALPDESCLGSAAEVRQLPRLLLHGRYAGID